MLPFDPKDPFSLEEASYEEEKIHSVAVDAWLGLKVEEVESRLPKTFSDAQERWNKVSSSIFLTPYKELRRIAEELRPQPGELLADLGAGYGRFAFVLHLHFPDVKFLGYELVPERVKEGQSAIERFGAKNAELKLADLADPNFFPEEAPYYFIYDYGSRQAIAKTLQDLRKIAQQRKITVVARGRGVRDQIEREHPWLAAVIPPKHEKHYSLYYSS